MIEQSVTTKRIGSETYPEDRESFVSFMGDSFMEWRDDVIADYIVTKLPRGLQKTSGQKYSISFVPKPFYVLGLKKTAALVTMPFIGLIGTIEGIIRGILFCASSCIPWTWETQFYKQECKKLTIESFQVAGAAFYYAIPQLFIDSLEDY